MSFWLERIPGTNSVIKSLQKEKLHVSICCFSIRFGHSWSYHHNVLPICLQTNDLPDMSYDVKVVGEFPLYRTETFPGKSFLHSR
jgi:hypothetical protein